MRGQESVYTFEAILWGDVLQPLVTYSLLNFEEQNTEFIYYLSAL